MSSSRCMAGLVVAALLVPGVIRAQMCVGNPELRPNAAGNVGLQASFFDGGKTYGASAVFGGPFFAHGNFGYTDYDDTTLSQKLIGGGVGYEIVPRDTKVSICPGVTVGYGFGLEILGVDFTTLTVAPVVAIGFGADVSPSVVLAPFAQGAVNWNRVRYDAGPLGEDSETDTIGALALGFGLIFNNRFSVGPAVYIPISEDDGDTVFGINLVFAVGGQR